MLWLRNPLKKMIQTEKQINTKAGTRRRNVSTEEQT
jgi:hypothetical protein